MISIPDRHQQHLANAALLCGVLLVALCAAPASADVLPPDICNVEGASCSNAGAGASSGVPGTCVTSTCTSWFPIYPDAGSQGGSAGVSFERHDYACLRCVSQPPHDAGPAVGAGGSTGGEGDAGPSVESEGDDQGCGCGLPGIQREGSLAAIMLGLGVLALGAGRRRR